MNWKVIGMLATLAGGVLTLVSNKADEEKMKEEIRKEVDKQLSLKESKEL